VSNMSPQHAEILKKVDVVVYDNTLTDDQVRRLACTHNSRNTGSKQTSWVQRVIACRTRLYEMEGLQYARDKTPTGSKEWKQLCRETYLDNNMITMPLQGLANNTKLELLKKLQSEELSLKEFKKECAVIKTKRTIQKAFMKFVGEEEWEEMVRKYPHHTTEDKLSQFCGLQWTRKGTPEVIT
ncbi:hypothetical protein QZH41_016436, partial [Actinostola sp. cb2023]